MPDRLTELRRQRALVQEQADWLDREIAACGGAKTPSVTAPGVPAANTAPVPLAPTNTSAMPEATSVDEVIYTPDPAGAIAQARRGCFLYFALALVLLGAALAAFFYLQYRDRPLLFMEKDAESPGSTAATH